MHILVIPPLHTIHTSLDHCHPPLPALLPSPTHPLRKKLSTFLQHPDWKNASNYVAKRYMKEEAREAYFEDVRVQMDAKLWGEEYTKRNPPKKASPVPTPPSPHLCILLVVGVWVP